MSVLCVTGVPVPTEDVPAATWHVLTGHVTRGRGQHQNQPACRSQAAWGPRPPDRRRQGEMGLHLTQKSSLTLLLSRMPQGLEGKNGGQTP